MSWRRFQRNSLVRVLVSNVGVQVAGIVGGIAVARYLGPSARGDLAAVVVWTNAVNSVFFVGLDQAYIYGAARERPGDLLGAGLVLNICFGLVVLGALYVMGIAVFSGSPRLDVLRIYMWFAPLSLMLALFTAYEQGRERWIAFGVLRLAVAALTLGAIAYLMITGSSSLLMYARVYVLTALGVVVVVALVSLWDVWPHVRRRTVRRLLSYGCRALPSVWASVIITRADQMILSALVPAAELGYYAVAVSLATVPAPIAASFAMTTFPQMARASPGHRRTFARRTMVRGILAVSSISLVLGLTASWLVPTLFGREFDPSVNMARILLVGAIFFAGIQIGGDMLRGLGRPGLASMSTAAAAVVTVALLPPLIYLAGAVGAAWVSTASYAIGAAATWLALRRALANDVGPTQ